MTKTAQTYRKELLFALRLRDVPGPRIAEALAEVDSHLSESGEDPLEAFGPPKAYADKVASALEGSGPSWRTSLGWTAAGYAGAGAVGTLLLLDGVLGISAGTRGRWGLPAAAALIVGLVVLAALAVRFRRLARSADTQVLDPRTGADMTPPLPAWVVPVSVAVPVLGLLLTAVVVFVHG